MLGGVRGGEDTGRLYRERRKLWGHSSTRRVAGGSRHGAVDGSGAGSIHDGYVRITCTKVSGRLGGMVSQRCGVEDICWYAILGLETFFVDCGHEEQQLQNCNQSSATHCGIHTLAASSVA